MQAVAILLIGLLGAGGLTEYARSLGAKALDQATLDAEGYGEKKGADHCSSPGRREFQVGVRDWELASPGLSLAGCSRFVAAAWV